MATKRADARQNREHLLSVAREMARAGTVPSFNALAREAQLGVGTVYRHFEDEQALLVALVEDDLAAFRALIDDALQREDAGAALDLLLRRWVDLLTHQPLVAKILAASPADFRALEDKAATLVTRARKQKALRRDVTVSDLRRLVCGIEHAAAAGEKPREAAARYVDIVLAGLRPERPAGKQET
ncbi:TetR/AcrR family transcriptional regulator [Chondromyces apiculatus]|uniref:Transcriptional regulator, TetR family n=1 Tax=Chondromyces apiculatus DSM 436 TaxID=1192034 RepID=A0A017SXT6_9BACT|nr:TetR family transcriptional regulator [Chondromyces apiculatus]EYF01788.1 Transcriptional regulator, TetR family [Chondromyces apiculatus DSM 436]